jgi:uncharacterized protein
LNHQPTHAVALEPTPDSEAFWAACQDGRLLLRLCHSCESVFYYPSRDLEWTEASGRGTVHTHTTVHTSFYGPDWEDDIPYTVLLVDLAEGPRMLSRLVGDDSALRTGASVSVRFYDIGSRRYPFFALDEGSNDGA